MRRSIKLTSILAVLIIIAAFIQLIIACYHAWAFTTDDAYISWRYASHLVHGEGLRWSPANPPVEGYSNFLWVILAALFIKLGLPVITAIKCFACLSLGIAMVFLYQLSRTFLSPLLATLPVYILSHYNGLIWWTVSGLETSLYMAMILFVSWQSVRAAGFNALKKERRTAPEITSHCRVTPSHGYDPVAWMFSCLGLTVLGLTRFDGAIWCIIIGVFIVCRIMCQANNDPLRLSLHWRSLLLIFLGCFILPYMAYFFWRIAYFNHVLPNSYACKLSTGGYLFQLIKDYSRIALPCFTLGLLPRLVNTLSYDVVPAKAWIHAQHDHNSTSGVDPHLRGDDNKVPKLQDEPLPYFFSHKDCRHSLLWLPSLIYSLLLFRADPTVAHYNRLFLGAFSVLTIIPVLGVQECFSYFHFKVQTSALASTVVILLFTHWFIPGHSNSRIDAAVKHYEQRSDIRREIAFILNEEAPKNARVLLSDCGIIPYFGRKDIQFIDSLCLNNGDMAAIKNRQSLSQYAMKMQSAIKPAWVVSTYYPLFKRSNALDDELRRIGFFNSYTLMKRYQSHRIALVNGRFIDQEADFAYLLYKKND